MRWFESATPTAVSAAAELGVEYVETYGQAFAWNPDAVVIANGQVLGDRDGYIDGAAQGDATALRLVRRELVRRDAKASADLGWVLSEKRLQAPGGAQSASETVLETMLLARTPSGWKITHIHWSGRRAG